MSSAVSPAAMVAKYIEAEQAILAGKTITFQGRSMGMEDLDKIRSGRKEWEMRAAQAAGQRSGRPSFGGMPFSVASFSRD